MSSSSRRAPFLCTLILWLLGVALMVGGGMAWFSLRQFEEIEARFQQMTLQDFRLTRGLRGQVNRTNYAALRFAVTGDPSYRDRFVDARQALDRFLEQMAPQIEEPFFTDLEARLRHYLDDAATLIGQSSLSATPEAVPGLLTRIEGVRDTIDEIGEWASDRNEERLESLRRDLQGYHHAVRDLQWFLVGGLTLIVLGIGLLWWGTGRAVVAPLRADLAEARQEISGKEALAQIGTMAAAVVHEIRNPITTMRARVFALEALLHEHEPAQEQAAVIEVQIERLERLSEDFLAFARPSAPQPQTVDLKAFLEEVAKGSEAAARARQVCLSTGPLVTTRVSLDPTQMTQALGNLLRNAIEAAQGKVRLSSTIVTDQVRLSVRDDGPGIAPAMLADLFTPFSTDKRGGTGLGLTIAKNLVEAHGGTLTVESARGEGTVFHLLLPL